MLQDNHVIPELYPLGRPNWHVHLPARYQDGVPLPKPRYQQYPGPYQDELPAESSSLMASTTIPNLTPIESSQILHNPPAQEKTEVTI